MVVFVARWGLKCFVQTSIFTFIDTVSLVSRKTFKAYNNYTCILCIFIVFKLSRRNLYSICFFFSSAFIGNTSIFRIRMALANLVSQYIFFSKAPYECGAERLFPNWLTSIRPYTRQLSLWFCVWRLCERGRTGHMMNIYNCLPRGPGSIVDLNLILNKYISGATVD